MVRADKIDKNTFQIKLVRTVFFYYFRIFLSLSRKNEIGFGEMHSCVLCVCIRPCMIPYWSNVCLRKNVFKMVSHTL